MFFPSKIIEALIEDHRMFRKDCKILKNSELSLRERQNALVRLVPNLVSHSRREEAVVYAFMKSTGDKVLQGLALAGEVEHRLLDQLIEEMKLEKMSDEDWSARALTLVKLVELHVYEEENENFPPLKKYLNSTADAELCRKYESLAGDRSIGRFSPGKTEKSKNKTVDSLQDG